MNLFIKNLYKFSIYSNQHHPIKELLRGKEIFYDHNIHHYGIAIQAYLQKRRTKKSEIAAKIYIIDQIPSISQHLQYQYLQPLKKLYDIEQLEKLSSYESINSQYIHSITAEDNLKNTLDEYLSKVLISGGVVPLSDLPQYTLTANKIKKLYKIFFYGDEQSLLENEIENIYLNQKQDKFLKYVSKQKPRDKCVWTYSQQKRLEMMINWRARDLNMFDDFRPLYMNLNLKQKLEPLRTLMDLNQESWIKKQIFFFFESGMFSEKSRKRYNLITNYLMNRILQYCSSLEFTKIMNIPPDFHIEHSLMNMHIWLIINRLRKINTSLSNFIAKNLELIYKVYTEQKVFKIHLKKKNEFIKDVNLFMQNNRKAYDTHFNKRFQDNTYKKIDALVWSTIFFEKIDRYGEGVYLMSEYMIQNYNYIQTIDLSAIEECNINFDVYLIGLDYKQKILKYNPPLGKEEFEKEQLSKNPVKKYYYNYEEGDQKLPLDDDNMVKKDNPVINKVNYGIFSFLRKYKTMDSYDYYSEREENDKQKKQEGKQSNWEKEKLEEDIEDIKAKRFKK